MFIERSLSKPLFAALTVTALCALGWFTLRAQAAQTVIGADTASGVNQVVRGVIEFNGSIETTQKLESIVNPTKSVVLLNDVVMVKPDIILSELDARTGACLIALKADSITVRIDNTVVSDKSRLLLSYQIVEYR